VLREAPEHSIAAFLLSIQADPSLLKDLLIHLLPSKVSCQVHLVWTPKIGGRLDNFYLTARKHTKTESDPLVPPPVHRPEG